MQAVDGERCVGAIVTTVICDCRQWMETGVLEWTVGAIVTAVICDFRQWTETGVLVLL